ncbi:MAG: O-antigen ligase family protein [Candidatus Omnitrophica bacterium]|nr:O-antigen ligase family protein [Candidatus Omnitrophota bacterium]
MRARERLKGLVILMFKKPKEGAFLSLLALVAALSFSIALFEIFFVIFLSFVLLSFTKEKSFGIYRNLFFLCAALYVLANLVSFFQTDYWYTSLRGMIKVLKNVLLCMGAYAVVDSTEKLKRVFQCFLFTAVVIGIDACFQGWLGRDLILGRGMTPFHGETQRLTGPFRHANDFSAYLSLLFILFAGIADNGFRIFSKKKYVLFMAGFVVTFICLLGTYSRGAWFAVAVSFFAMVFYKRSRWLVLLAVLAVGGAALFSPPLLKERFLSSFDRQSSTVIERKELWGESLRMIRERPYFGWGINTYARHEPRYKSPDVKSDNQYAHNGYLQMAAEIGWIGLGSFVFVIGGFLAQTLRAFWDSRGEGALRAIGTAFTFAVFSFLLHSLTDTNLHSILLVNTLWLVMGLALAAGRLYEGTVSA